MGKEVKSRFGLIYQNELKNWSEKLLSIPGIIVAIARKGPKLLDLMIREGFLPPNFLERVITEKALPFITRVDDGINVVDDGVIYGSTFSRVNQAVENLVGYQHNNLCKGLPFAVSDLVSEEAKGYIDDYSLTLHESDINCFIFEQMLAHRLSGKPFDIEFPIIEIKSDYSNIELITHVLNSIARRINGEVINLSSDIPNTVNIQKVYTWTILNNYMNSGVNQPELNKFRIYLDPNLSMLRNSFNEAVYY